MTEWIAYACASALLTGLMPSFLKTGARKAAPAMGTALLSTVVFLFALGIVLLEGRIAELLALPNDSLLYLLLSGTLQAVYWLCLCSALTYGDVNRVIPITNLKVSAAIGISYLVFHTQPGLWKLVCIALLLLGTILLESRSDGSGDVKWVLFSFLALAALAARTLTDSLCLNSLSGSVTDLLTTLVSAVVLWCIALLGRAAGSAARMEAVNWIFLVLAGAAVGLSWLCDSRASLMGDPSYLLPIACAAFPAAMLGARIFHQEKMPAGAMFGILLVLAGMFGLLLNL